MIKESKIKKRIDQTPLPQIAVLMKNRIFYTYTDKRTILYRCDGTIVCVENLENDIFK